MVAISVLVGTPLLSPQSISTSLGFPPLHWSKEQTLLKSTEGMTFACRKHPLGAICLYHSRMHSLKPPNFSWDMNCHGNNTKQNSSEVTPILFHGAYSQESVHRTAAHSSHFLIGITKPWQPFCCDAFCLFPKFQTCWQAQQGRRALLNRHGEVGVLQNKLWAIIALGCWD